MEGKKELQNQWRVNRDLKKWPGKTSQVSATRLKQERAVKDDLDLLHTDHVILKKEIAKRDKIIAALELTAEHNSKKVAELSCALRQFDIKSRLKKQKTVGRRGGGSKWPVAVAALVMEFLVNRTLPTAIPANIVTMFAFFGITLDDLPCVNFCRECRPAVQVFAETLTAFWIGRATSWLQAFFDATGRWQQEILNFIVGIHNENNKMESHFLSASIIPEDGTAEKQIDAITERVSSHVMLFLTLIVKHPSSFWIIIVHRWNSVQVAYQGGVRCMRQSLV